MARYIHRHEDQPGLWWDKDPISHELAAVRHRQKRLLGRMESLGFGFRSEVVLQLLTEDVIKSSAIEGENLDREQVRSSVPRRFEMDIDALAPVDPVLKAAIVHLWFVTIYPFEEGNVRMAQTTSDPMLVRSEQTGQHFYCLSAQIRQKRKNYYAILEATQKGEMDITPWLPWHLRDLDRAFDRAELVMRKVVQKACC